MRFKKLIFAIFAVIFLFSFFASSTLAQQQDATFSAIPKATEIEMSDAMSKLSPSRVLPGYPLYFVITLKENIQRFFQPNSAAKAQWDMVLAGKRLREAYQLAYKNDVKGANRTLQHYQQHVDSLREEYQKAKSANQNTDVLSDQMSTQFTYQQSLLASFLQKLPTDPKKGVESDVFASAKHLNNAIQTLSNDRPAIKDFFEGRMKHDFFLPPPVPQS